LTLGRDDLAEARRLLDEVIATEPGYAESYALLSNWHSLMIGQGWSKDRRTDILAVERMAQQALTLDGDNVRALVLYAHRRSLLHRDYQAAQEMFGHALSVMPSSAFAWVWSSFTSAYVGDPDEAFRRASRALELSPRDREAHIFLSAFCVANCNRCEPHTAVSVDRSPRAPVLTSRTL
jgi:tetratricopeptide (TPR) repeat protein